MRVAVISNFFPPDFVGGAEIYAYRVAKELAKMGIDVSVVTSTKGKREVLELDGMKVYRVTKPLPLQRITGNLFGYNFNPSSYHIKTTLNEINPDIIHIHNINSTIMFYPLVRFLNSRVLVHVHDHWPICYAGTLYNMKMSKYCDDDCINCAFRPGFRIAGNINLRFREKLIAQFEKKVDLFITPSNYLREKLIEKGFLKGDKIMHIPLGLDLGEFTPGLGTQNGSNILFVGRLASYKNPSLIIRILPKILKSMDCKYQIVGKGPEKQKLKDLSIKLGVENHVEMYEGLKTPELVEKIRSANVLVVPSVWHENSPVVIYEALACGTPPIVSNLGGPKELIDEGKSGFAIDPLNEDGWTKAILSFLGNRQLMQSMRIEARKKAEQEYDIRKNAERILNVYEGL